MSITTQVVANMSMNANKGEKKEATYTPAPPEVEVMCKKVMSTYPDKFGKINANDIVFAFKDAEKSKYHAQVRLLKGVTQIFTNKKIGIIVFKPSWETFDEGKRALLIKHELTHVLWDEEKEKYKLKKHDVEDFEEIITPYGTRWENSNKVAEEMKNVAGMTEKINTFNKAVNS